MYEILIIITISFVSSLDFHNNIIIKRTYIENQQKRCNISWIKLIVNFTKLYFSIHFMNFFFGI